MANKRISILWVIGFFVVVSQVEAQVSFAEQNYPGIELSTGSSIPLTYDLFEPDKCAKYKRMKKVGTVLTIVGGSLFVGGIVGISAWAVKYGSINDDFDIDEGLGLLVVSYFGLLGGIGCTGAGIPLMIIGNKKSKQYCNTPSGSLYIVPEAKGVGLQLRF